MPAEVPNPDHRQIVLFDGVCAVCDALVVWILDRDPSGQFVFAPLQGETASELRERHPQIPDGVHTIVLVDQRGEREEVTVRSRAIFAILRQLTTPWRGVAVLRWLPRLLTDLGYQAFARIRYRVFGKRDSCRIPEPQHAERFLP
jgi:predicted DCC family thiol-disulfide oxidoreductase YuxK